MWESGVRGKGGSRELRSYWSDYGNSLWWLASENGLYLGHILEIAPTGFTDGLDLGFEKKRTVMSPFG